MNFINPNIYYAFPQVPNINNPQPQSQINVYGNQQIGNAGRMNIVQPIKQYTMKHVMSVEQIQGDTVPINGDPVFYSIGDTDVIYKSVWQNGGIQMSKFRIIPFEEEVVQQQEEIDPMESRLQAIEQAIGLLNTQLSTLTSQRSEQNEPVVSKRKQSAEKPTATKQPEQ